MFPSRPYAPAISNSMYALISILIAVFTPEVGFPFLIFIVFDRNFPAFETALNFICFMLATDTEEVQG